MQIFKNLGYNKGKIKIKEFLTLFIIILIPNFLRQFMYIITAKSTGLTDFILSPETQQMYVGGNISFGFIEEIIIGLIFAFFWFKFRKLKWFSYGWIGDVLTDIIYVFVWFNFGVVLFSNLNFWMQVFIREFLIGYVLFGSYMYYKKARIWKWSLFVVTIGVLLLLIIII